MDDLGLRLSQIICEGKYSYDYVLNRAFLLKKLTFANPSFSSFNFFSREVNSLNLNLRFPRAMLCPTSVAL